MKKKTKRKFTAVQYFKAIKIVGDYPLQTSIDS